MKVLGAEVARVMRSMAARGEEADLVRARKGWRNISGSGRHDRSDILLLEHSGLSFAPCLPLGVWAGLSVKAISSTLSFKLGFG